MRILILALAGLSGAAAAQDLSTSPLDHTGVMALGSAANAQARQVARGGGRTRHTTDAEARRECASIPSLRRRLGDDPRLDRMTILCRKAGYR